MTPLLLALGLTVASTLLYHASQKSIPADVHPLINAAVAVLLVPTGLLLFGERLSAGNAAGLLLCLAGMFLLSQR